MNESATRQERRQRQQHVAGEAAVRRVDAHLPLDLEPLAHHVREVVENLRQVAAGVALNQDGGDEEPHVEDGDALGQLVERLPQRQAVVLLIEGLLDLRARPAPASRRRPCRARSETRARRGCARDSTSSASGNCSSNVFMRADRLCFSHANGSSAPSSRGDRRRERLRHEQRGEQAERRPRRRR